MRQRILTFGFAVLATGLWSGTSIQAASRYHLVVVHSEDNTGEGVVTVDRGSARSCAVRVKLRRSTTRVNTLISANRSMGLPPIVQISRTVMPNPAGLSGRTKES